MYSSASMIKGKKQSLGSYEQEQARTMGKGQRQWQNPNIDPTMPRTHAVHIVRNEHGGSVKAAVNARLHQALGDKTIRKDAVTHLPFYATCPNYSQLTPEERKAFVNRVFRFLAKRYGADNVVDMRWHFDESTPHLHCTVVPITPDGRLCAKDLFKPTKQAMEKWQREYYHEVAEPLGYDQPDFGHSAEKGYTKETIATKEQLRDLTVECDLKAAELKDAQEAVKKANMALERLSERFTTILRQLTEVAETMRYRPWIGDWKRALEALKDNPIAQKAVEAGRPWVHERHAKKADEAIKKEIKDTRRTLDEWTREAREGADALNRQRGYRGGHDDPER